MAYELSIQSPAGEPDLLERLLDDLADKGAVSRAEDGGGAFRLEATTVRLRADDAGRVEASLPFGALGSEVEEALGVLLDAGARLHAKTFDPQLGREVGAGEAGAVAESFEAVSRWHVEYAGRTEDVRQGVASAQAVEAELRPRLSMQLKIVLGLAALLVLAWGVFRACVVSPMLDQLAPVGEPIEGPPPGWLATHPPVSPDPPSDAAQ